jgi:hypothetical protein
MSESYMSDDEVEALQSSPLNRNTPFAIRDVSYGYFSIARHYGSIKYNGQFYTYFPDFDECIRDDVLKWINNRRKESTND